MNSNQGKENLHGSALARVLRESEIEFAPSDKGQNHYHNASSLNADAEYRTKPPGVVARLMGLDSLPTSNVNESCLNPFTESPSFGDSSYIRYPPTLQKEEHDIVIFQSVRNKLDGLSKNPLDLRLQKAHNRPIEKFQTEVLPPKSSKPISVTQHRLLSPIKSPRFIPSKNAAYIIEAAAKIMEQSPRANVKSRLPSFGSSYVPLKIHDLKEKMESAEKSSRSAADASQRYKEHKSIKSMKKQHSAESCVQSANGVLDKGIEESERVGSQRLSKEKSVSLAVEAKSSFQKRDGSTSVENRSSAKQKEYTDIKNSCVNRNRPTAQKTLEKRSSSRKPSEVLRLNNQKQNWAFNKETEIFEPSSSHSRDKKASSASTNYINGEASRTVNKIVVNSVATSRKTNLVAADPGRELSSSRAKTTSKKKLPINRNTQSDGSVAQKQVMMKYERDDCEWDKVENKNNLDVVSFTFTSPIKKSGTGSNSCGTISKMSSRSLFPNFDPCVRESESPDSSVPSSEFNVVCGDSLSVLLETKLQELTSRIELSQQGHPEEGSFSCSANCYGDLCPTVSLSSQQIQDGSHSPSINKSGIKSGKDYEGLEHIEEDDNVISDSQRYNHFQGPCSVSNQLSFSDARGEPLHVDKRLSNEHCVSPELNEGINWFSTRKSYTAGGYLEISDTASSISGPTLCRLDSNDPSCSVLQYIQYIICSAELSFEEFALGLTCKIVPPDFFHHLENQLTESNKITVMGERFMIEHKVLFDCVGECLEVKCGRLLAGSKMWAKQTTHFHERQRLVEEVYREISRWINSDELMVDETVDKDMSCKNGQWVDFEIEGFEEGVEIGNRILSSLVDELVDDFLF
ncbi:hypothetical protein OROGR_004151 [Orobanche gracilis]